MNLIVVFVLAMVVMVLSGLARFMGWQGLDTAVLDFVFLASAAACLALVITIEARRLHRHFHLEPNQPAEKHHDRPVSNDDRRERG